MPEFKNNRKKVNEDDLKNAKEKLNESTKKNGFGIEAFSIMKDFITLCWDYVNGDYTQLPLTSFLAISGAVIYFVSPIDAIPDFIPVLGYTDDAAAVLTVYSYVKSDVEDYRAWKKHKAA